MFGRDSQLPPENPPEGPQIPLREFRLPNLSTWEIWWLKFNGDLTKEIVIGHGMTIGNTGSLTISTFRIDPVTGPTPIPTWGRSSYVSFRDITPVVVEAPRELIIH